ncbi:caspase family protein [Nostoc sp. 'Peltigera membranacea cyanobiont' N6]|uniref:caspase family protein n=1 Tax=Nostoc sp. 'Peltigera membranacea cyanobiont' N6 TaxID=1261031 RepID=UPI000CF3527F|nr:caspase family protein [Nostoc sp. 'Peltigera membranacea cyanobiont' N6]AVH63882.1 caspase domain-containing protein [Nostoc sp. 'Peltigera membranacea cyanobiont' N6]
MPINSEAQAILEKLRQVDAKLNSPQVLFTIDHESDQRKKDAFNEARTKIAVQIRQLEDQKLSLLFASLQSNEASFHQGIDNLNSEIEAANNIAKITEAIDKVLSVVTAIVIPTRGIGSRKIYVLLVGIDNYPDPKHRLDGCVNDITAITEYLNERFDPQEYQLHLLKLQDEQATREAIINGFRNHLCQAQKDDVVLFYYSGHGSQELAPKEFWHIEPDHLDETLVCHDSRTENGWDLADKELAKLIAEVAEKEPHITIIMDCCHSGSGTKDPMQEAKERRFPADKRERPLDSFIFKLEDLEKLTDSRDRDPEKYPTGWKIPKGRHVLLAACRDYETAKEYPGKFRGYFSYYLLDTLTKTNGKLTYRDLFARTNAIVRSEGREQSPQLEVNHPQDSDKLFLDGAIAEVAPYFIVNHDKTSGWVIEGGVVHGVQPPKNGETTLFALFKFDANNDDLRDPSKSVGTAKVTQVLPTKSKIDIEGVENLATDSTFKAVVTSLPLPPLGVSIEGDEAGVNLACEQLNKAGLNGKPSAYVRESQEIGNADLRLLCYNDQYVIARPTDEHPIVAQIDGYTPDNAEKAIKRLEHIARWTTIAQLKNTAATQIKTGDVKMELIFKDEDLSQSQQMRLQYKSKDGKWQPPEFKLKLTNTTKKPFYCALVNLSDSFSISAPFFESGSIRLQQGESAYALDGEELILEVPDEYWKLGITEYKDIIKLIVSNDEFDARLLNQDKLDAPRPRSRNIESANQSSFERLMDRTQNREIRAKSSAVSFDDWYAEEITITTVRPLESTPVSQEQEQQLAGGVKLQPHPSLVANVRLTTTPQVSRDLGNKIVPPILRENPEVIRPFQFTISRGTDPGLSVLELSNVKDHEVVTPDAPLKLLVDGQLANNEYLLPVGYDGEFFLPLGRGKATGDAKIEIELERLPAPVSEGERSLEGSIRIFFQKVIGQGLGREFEYPILAVASVGEDKKVTYNQDENYVKQQIAQAKRIALYIHGIIGDTESLVSTIKQPVLQLDGQKSSISELYDVVLTFDYENLNTNIEQNAQHLKRRLKDVGLSENHGKQLHIIAHSMGGLVSRWFIEREGGNKVVQHLIMLGTPNAGSPWAVVEDWVKLTLGIALNSLATVAPPATVVGTLLGTLEKNIRVSLAQMNPGSEFLNSLAASDDPGIPYSIIAGNTSIIAAALEEQPQKKSSILKRLQQRLFNKVVELPFFGVPNDIAVKVDSIKSVPTARSHPPYIQEVPCDHMSYFLGEPTEVGLQALIAAITKQR